ncbi:hypothetical protein N7E02_07395 (plasmid) [Aliirhizobium terrae]|uniref:hypothetical protein n=1 Tax=Terrirhizobium terrae TaxID=2926709 RepID=UPI0025789788|nr:hypothetical protein [Rhizobium sp. CC-CFT758]WJH38440.1 hypothetical protein N7E02_07395 [Rhizobium sp. CC-CFT758]
MNEKKTDGTSDAVRSNPDVADDAREDLSHTAEKGLRKATSGGRYKEDVDTSKTPEDERKAPRNGEGYPGATTK